MKKVLFVGLGSAGQRHLRNLMQLLDGDIKIMAYRHHKSERVFDENLKVVEASLLNERYQIEEFTDYEDALSACPDFVVIATPNNMHIDYALRAARYGIDIFIEKPLSVTEEKIDALRKIVHEKQLICQIGFQHRYNPAVIQMKQWVDEKAIGSIVSIDAEIGEYLPLMHSYEDYRTMVEARTDLGGGVVLCQCHELDILFWIFGYPTSVYSIGGSLSNLGVDVEDIAESLFRYSIASRVIPVRLHQDYLQFPAKRAFKIIGSQGMILVDILNYRVKMIDFNAAKESTIQNYHFTKNEMFLAEMQDFLHCINTRAEPSCNLEDALGSLRMGIAIKKSISLGGEVAIYEA